MQKANCWRKLSGAVSSPIREKERTKEEMENKRKHPERGAREKERDGEQEEAPRKGDFTTGSSKEEND